MDLYWAIVPGAGIDLCSHKGTILNLRQFVHFFVDAQTTM